MDDEARLIKNAQKGDDQAFEILYQKYIKMTYGYVFNRVGKKEEAEDLTSEIWLAVLEGLPKFAAASTFKNWLFGIVKHKIMDFYQEKYKIKKIPLVEEIILAVGDEEINKDDKEKKVTSLLAKLPKNYREVLSLRFLKGYTTREIAEELGLTVNNIKVIQYRALRKAQLFKV